MEPYAQPVERLTIDVAVGIGRPAFRMSGERVADIAATMLSRIEAMSIRSRASRARV